MAGRFNKILEFIGLVDDEPDEELDQGRRPTGGQTYGGASQNRRSPMPPPRAPRGEYDERSSGRYNSSPRPDYDARQRRESYSAREPRYSPESGYSSDYRSAGAPRDYSSAGRDYASSGRDYPPYAARDTASSAARDSRSSRATSLDDEFERPAPKQAKADRDNRGQGNIVPMRPQAAGHQTMIYYLRSLEECRDVINDLLDGKSVLLNVEDMDDKSVQRSVDTLCGAAFALGATLRKASEKTFLIAPNNVAVASTNEDGRHY